MRDQDKPLSAVFYVTSTALSSQYSDSPYFIDGALRSLGWSYPIVAHYYEKLGLHFLSPEVIFKIHHREQTLANQNRALTSNNPGGHW